MARATGKINNHGIMTIVVDTNMEILAALPLEGNVEAKYIPCERCGKLQIVPLNVVVVNLCGPCDQEELEAYRNA